MKKRVSEGDRFAACVGEADRDSGPAPGAAVDRHRLVEPVRQATDDREADAVSAASAGFAPHERLKNSVEFAARDANARVADHDRSGALLMPWIT